MPETTETAVKTGMKIVLNGGSNVMDAATLPIQWFFSGKVIEKNPTHILIIDQTEKEVEKDDGGYGTGRRFVRNVTDRVCFLQIFAPGKHRITAIALNFPARENREIALFRKRLCEKDAWGGYMIEINSSVVEFLCRSEEKPYYICYPTTGISATVAELEVPRELFASKGETAFGKRLFRWVNRWWPEEPHDECAYRARFLFAFTIQPILMLLGYTVQSIGVALGSAGILLARIFVLLIGFRPVPFFQGVAQLWDSPNGEVNWDELLELRRKTDGYVGGKYRPRYGYRVWTHPKENKTGQTSFMPITGLELFGLFLLVFLGMKLMRMTDVRNFMLTVGAATLAGGGILIGLRAILATAWWRNYPQRMAARGLEVSFKLCEHLCEFLFGWMKPKKESEGTPKPEKKPTPPAPVKEIPDPYQTWLKTELPLAKTPATVDLKNLPKPYGSPLVQKFRVSFWWAKMKVCRPFEKN